jgi:hypothetical protein
MATDVAGITGESKWGAGEREVRPSSQGVFAAFYFGGLIRSSESSCAGAFMIASGSGAFRLLYELVDLVDEFLLVGAELPS